MNTYSYNASTVSNFVAFLPVVFLILGILYFVAWCKIFRKAGLPWERLFVPIYGSYWMYKIAGCGGIFWIIFAASFAFILLLNVLGAEAGLIVLAVYLLLLFILHSIYAVKLVKAFGKGGGFALGLVFLFPIFIMILGYGRAEYEA